MRRCVSIPERDGDFALYRDDGTTYAYEQGKLDLTRLHWSDGSGELTQSGSPIGPAAEADLSKLVEVVGRQR